MKILIVEDEAKTAAYLQRGLTEQGHVVDVAADGVEGSHAALEFTYDLIVLDVMLPGFDGFEVLRRVRQHKKTPILMLTARDRVDDRVRGLRSGADDYLVKPFSFLELTARLEVLGRRLRLEPKSSIAVGDLMIDLLARRVYRQGDRIDLTSKEFALLLALAQRVGRVQSRTELAELVWDIKYASNTNVVEVAVKRLRAKIEGPNSIRLLHTVRGMGYVFECREDSSPERNPREVQCTSVP